MRREFLFATIIAAALSVSASAHSSPGQSGTGMTGPGAGTGSGKPGQAGQAGTIDEGGMKGGGFGVVDLLKGGKNDITMTGCVRRAEPSASGAARAFVLTHVRTGAPSSATSVREATGTSGTVPVTLSGKDSDLREHVGQRVELRGKWDDHDKAAPTNGVPFKVSAVKAAEGSCPAE